jgi:hypothetical protein
VDAAAIMLSGTDSHTPLLPILQELNLRGSHLLFRDKRHQLHVYDLATQTRSSLLDFCQYVQWVPGSDVVVAQSRSNLCVWYSVKNPDRLVWEGKQRIRHLTVKLQLFHHLHC